jgi:hypothetical protein
MNNSNVGELLGNNNEDGQNSELVARAVSENVQHLSVKFKNNDDLMSGAYEKDKDNNNDEPEITFEESNESNNSNI